MVYYDRIQHTILESYNNHYYSLNLFRLLLMLTTGYVLIVFLFRWLPLKGLRAKQVKTVLCVRNPKDAAVSLFNHLRGERTYKYEGRNFQDFVPFYLDRYCKTFLSSGGL